MGASGRVPFMCDNPIHFFLQSLVGEIGDQAVLHFIKWPIVALWWLMIGGGIAIAVHVWRTDPAQRTATHLTIFATRMVAAGMWYLGTLWKLPWPVSDGFKDWLGNTVKYSSFQWHADIMQVFLDHIDIVQAPVFVLETFLGFSLMWGVFVRFSGVLGALFTFNLLIGLYNHPTEWAWTYIAIICCHVMFAATQAGRSLGLDHLVATGRFARGGVIDRLRWAT